MLELAEAEVHSTCELEAMPSPEKPKRKQKVKTPNVKPKVTKDVDITTANRQAKELFGKSDSESDITRQTSTVRGLPNSVLLEWISNFIGLLFPLLAPSSPVRMPSLSISHPNYTYPQCNRNHSYSPMY